MELLEVYRYPQFIRSAVFAAKFTNVKNAGAIRARIVKAATMEGPEGDEERDAVNFAFINARLVRGLSPPRRCSSWPDYKPSAFADSCCPDAVCRV